MPDAETIAEKQACVGYEDVELKGINYVLKKREWELSLELSQKDILQIK